MSLPTPQLLAAKTDAELKRKRFLDTLGEVQTRLAPSTIARNAIDNARGKGEEIADQTLEFALDKAEQSVEFARAKTDQTIVFAREQPAVAGAAAGALAAFLVRKPLARGIRRLLRGRKSSRTPINESLGAIAARAGD